MSLANATSCVIPTLINQVSLQFSAALADGKVGSWLALQNAKFASNEANT